MARTSTGETQIEALREAIALAVAPLDLALYDVELIGGQGTRTLRVTVTRDGGVDLDAITAATRAISPVVDATNAIPGSFLLEVSSPGIERTLRRPDHYEGALGELVSVKFHTPDGPRRVRGTLREVDDAHVVVDTEADGREVIALGDITQARTVFEWGPEPRPSKPKTKARAKGRS